MPKKTNIGWTEATWNPFTGCTKVSEGCDNCYAEFQAERHRGQRSFLKGFDLTLRPQTHGANELEEAARDICKLDVGFISRNRSE